jgi:hypothetical protein
MLELSATKLRRNVGPHTLSFGGKSMLNVGVCLYKKGEKPGTLAAKWAHPYFGEGVFGSGSASGGPTEGYVGNYDIHYFSPDGEEIGAFELQIKSAGEYYELAWVHEGEILDKGIGMEVSDGLAVGWRRLSDRPIEDYETNS